MQKVIVTGANGFIGSQLMTQLHRMGFEARGLIRESSDISLIPEELHPHLHHVDYFKPEQLYDALSGYEIVYHLAGMTKAFKRSELMRANVDVTRHLLKAAIDNESVQHFVFLSSQAAAGQAASEGQCKLESDACKPVSGYGKSKLEAEKLLHHCEDIDWTIVRPASVFGPGDRDFLSYFRMAKMHLIVLLAGKRKFSAIYSKDLVRFLSMLPMQEKTFRQTFFVSDGIDYSFDQFIDYLEEAIATFAIRIHLPVPLIYPAALLSEIFGRIVRKVPILNFQRVPDFAGKRWLCSSEKAKRLIGWEPDYDPRDALMETYKWYQDHNWL